ncbi:MAG TPA: alpha/beta hydrolase [Stellaceae bacterium]|jgi:triacylglycerol lipase
MSDAAEQVAAEIRKLGRAFNSDVLKATYAIYTPLQERAPKDGIEIARDLAYGPDARNRLDIYMPAQKPTKAPVVVYFHGGGYVAGERSPLPGLIYDNVPTFFARNGIIGVNATYRLAPQHKWPSGAEDVGKVVAWLHDNIAKYGGDPARIFIMGQSAGATHVATWTFVPQVHGSEGPRIAGALLLSGVYAPQHPVYSPGKPAENSTAYYGEDESKYAAMSPLNHVKPGHPPVFVCVTEFDPYPLAWPSAALVAELAKCDKKMPWFVFSRNHNHVSPAMQINSAVDSLGPELLAFINNPA